MTKRKADCTPEEWAANLEYQRKSYAANPEKVREQARKRYAANPDKKRESERHRKYRLANPEKGREYSRKRRARNPEQARASCRKWSAARPVWVRAWYSLRSKAKGEPHAAAEELHALWERQEGRCAFAGVPLGKDAHLDHVTPISKGGTHTIENLQWVLPELNRAKGVIPDGEFRARLKELVRAYVANGFDLV